MHLAYSFCPCGRFGVCYNTKGTPLLHPVTIHNFGLYLISGSWSTHIDQAGETVVRLMMNAGYETITGGGYHYISWTLLVLPDEEPRAPVVSDVGLIVMAVIGVGLGAVAFKGRVAA